MKPVVVGITGASGAILAKTAVERLIELSRETVVICTKAGREVWAQELGAPFEETAARWARTGLVAEYQVEDLSAPISSGTFPVFGMVVIPCSMATLSAIAHGSSADLLQRAADVCLKERRQLVLVPRETPLSAIHLQNMLTLAQLGVAIVPPMPAFYQQPRSIEEMAENIACRALAALGIEEALEPKQRYYGKGGSVGEV